MAKIIGLPKLSPTMEEGTLVVWSKKEGDKVEVDDLLAEVETDKATMEFRSFDKGVLLKILVEEGDTLSPDEPVAIIGGKGDDIEELLEDLKNKGNKSSDKDNAPKEESEETKDKSSDKEESETKQKKSTQNKKTKETSEASEEEPSDEASNEAAQKKLQTSKEKKSSKASSEKVIASPYVRKVALQQDLDLSQIEGSGPKGRIVMRDVEEGASNQKMPSSTSTRRHAKARVEKASQMRKAIARRLTESKQNVPHFYLTIDVDAKPMMKLRELINEELAKVDEKISLNDILLKACGVALRRKPEVNASWVDGEIHFHPNVDISVAVAVEGGLVTPVLRDADALGLQEIGREVRSLAKRAKQKELKREEMQNGTFSVSNLGMYGIEEFSAVINPPEGAILAIGTVREVPVVKNDKVKVGHRMKLTMSCDHRVIDGALGAEWLAILKDLLEHPGKMLL